MTPFTDYSHETSAAFEELLLKKNGDPKTVADLFECFVAMHHDQKANWAAVLKEIRAVAASVTQHQTQDVNMTKEQFAEFMAGRDRLLRELEERIEDRLDTVAAERHVAEVKLDAELKSIWSEIHREPRRSGDGETEDWGRSLFGGDTEERQGWWEVLLAWKTLKWFVAASVLVALDIFARFISHVLLGYPS